MADVASLYPQPPAAAQPNALASSDPSKILGMIGQANQLQLFNKEFAAKQAVGDAAQGAIGPDGRYDPTANALAIRNNPAASFGAPEAIAGVLARQGAQIEQTRGQAQDATNLFGAISNIDKPTALDVHKAAALAAAQYPNLPPEVIAGITHHILGDPAGIKHGAAVIQTMGMGASGASARTPGPPAPGGAPTMQPLGSANIAGATVTGNAPGEEALLASPAERAARLQATASTTQQYHADLDNLKQLSKTLQIGGPTVEIEKKLGQLSSRFGLTATMTGDQLKSVEEFDKIANQISLNQSQNFHGSDAGLHTVVGANPSSSMSTYGREGVIDMLQGNQDAIEVTRRAWLQARANGAPVSSHDLFMERMGQELDPRVFQFNRMSRENQQKFLSQMDPGDLKDFEDKFKGAVEKKWVKPLKTGDDATNGKRSEAAPPIAGARLAPDGNYYVSDPNRPGKYSMVG
jgi:hypothetical protein